MPYKASEFCEQKLMYLEGYRMMPYKDTGGLWTIGFGQRCKPEDYPHGIPREEAKQFLVCKLFEICQFLQAWQQGLTQQQVDALCLFIYNIGIEGFKGGTVDDLLKQRKVGALVKWQQYIHDAHGEVQEGLVTRRKFETELFVYGW